MEARELSSPQPEQAKDPNRFDTQTHYWDKQGRCYRTNLYNLFIENGAYLYERPIGSGNLWNSANKPCGRTLVGAQGRTFHYDAPHVDYVAPKTADQLLQEELGNLRNQNAELEKELAAIRKEQESKVAQAAPATTALEQLERSEKPRKKG